MPKTLITIIGDQAAPSLLFLRDQHFQDAAHYIFITSELMESRGRLEKLVQALQFSASQYSKIIVSHNDPEAIGRQLQEGLSWDLNSEYHINLSSGSKIMSIGVFNFFADGPLRDRCRIYYLSIYEDHFLEIFPRAGRQLPLTNTISLEEYMQSYGISILSSAGEADLTQPPDYTAAILEQFLEPADSQAPSPFYRHKEAIRKHLERSKQSIELSGRPDLQQFLQDIGFPLQSEDRLSVSEADYLRGGWWEEWVFQAVKKGLAPADEAVALRVRIEMEDRDGHRLENEFDVVFLYRNALYVLECKTGLGYEHDAIRNRLDEELHRLAALRRIFGMNVRTGLFTLSDQLRRKPASPAIRNIYKNRAELLFIKLLDRFDHLSGEWLKQIIRL